MPSDPQPADVAVLTVIGPELQAVLAAFGLDSGSDRKRLDGALYWEASIRSVLLSDPLHVVIHTIGEAGTDEASARAMWLRGRFQPAAILLVGIAAGRRAKIKIGDVLVSRGVVDHTRQVAIDGEMFPRIAAPPLTFPMKQMLAAYRVQQQEFEDLAQKLFGKQLRVPVGFEVEFENHVARRPSSMDGEIASANTLLRDKNILEKLSREVHQGIKVGEMEASGVVRACNQGQTPIAWLIIRGVSDFGDDFKSDEFHEWASSSAASYTKLFLEQGFDLRLLRDEEPNRTLEKLEQLSALGTEDAAFVQRAFGSAEPELRLDELYATRKVEAQVLSSAKPDGPRKKSPYQPIAIIGDAGEGKTSLLWRLAARLRQEQGGKVFFLKASSLRLETNSPHSGMVTAEEILDAVLLALRKSVPVFLLLDTVDLIVRDAAHRDAILLLAARVEAAGCQLLITCRRQEFSFLVTSAVASLESDLLPRFVTFELGDYDDDEFRDAVNRHVERFYRGAEPGEADQQAQRLFVAVAAGRPVRELCFRPLTLRMLFTLYAPHEIPSEIHTFRLYTEFWSARVRDDRRAGTPSVSTSGQNLEQPAGYIALTMLAESRVEAEQSLLEPVLKRFGCPSDSIAALLSRDVLHADTQGRVRFFHQTLFEHAAARGLHLLGTAKAEPFVKDIMANPNDLFAAPVVEQWLLLVLQDGLKPARDIADQLTSALLESDHINHQFSGIYVYVHAPVDLPLSSKAMVRLLERGEDNGEVIKRYVALLPNRAFRDGEAALSEIARVWAREDWNLTLQVLLFLERYAGEHPTEVARFLDLDSKLRGKLSVSTRKHYFWELLRVAKRVGARAPTWLWEVLVWMHHKQTKNSAKTDFVAKLVELLCEHAAAIPQEQFCSFFLEEIPERLERNWKDIPTKAADVYGLAWAKVWELQRLQCSEIINQVKQVSRTKLRFALAGLAHYVAQRVDPALITSTIDAFDKELEISLKSQWLVVFWPITFRYFYRAPDGPTAALVTEFARRVNNATLEGNEQELDLLLRSIGDENYGALEEWERFGALLSLVFKENIFEREELWRKLIPLRRHLGRSALVEHPTARRLVDGLASGEVTGVAGDYRSLLVQLTNYRFESRWARWALLRLALRWQDYEAAADAFEAIVVAHETNHATVEQRTQIKRLCAPLLRDRGGPSELAQMRLRLACFRHDWDVLPGLAELLDELAETANTKRFGLLLSMLEIGYRRAVYAPAALFDWEASSAHFGDSRLKEMWEEALTVCLAEYPHAETAVVERSFSLVSVPSAGLNRLRLFARVLEKATVVDVERALQMTMELFTGPAVRELGRSATYALSHKLQVPIAHMIKACNADQRRGLLAIVPEAPPVLGASLVHLICSVYYTEVKTDLEALASNPKTDDFVRSMLLKQSRNRRVDFESKGYGGLAEILSQDPMR